MQKHLWLIKRLADKYPNSGSLTVALSDFYKRIKNEGLSHSQIPQLISILTDLIINSPKSIPNEVLILGEIFNKLNDNEISEYIDLIMKKVSRKANTEYSEIWLQRLSIMINYKYVYKGKLAKKVTSNSIKVWNSDWCKEDINFNEDCLIDYEKRIE